MRQAIAEQFAIGVITSTQDLGGTYNLNVLLLTTGGTYVARVYRPWVTYERLAMLHQVKQVLYENGLPVPTLIVNRLGKTIFSYQDRLAEVECFVPHDNVEGTWQHYELAFALLARLHTSLATKTGRITIVPPLVANYATPNELVTWTLQAKQRISKSTANEDTGLALALCDSTVQLLTKIQGEWDKTGHELPRQMIHGDFRLGNFIFRGEQIVAILDFDFLAVRERIFDLAYALYWMFRRLESNVPPDKLSWSRINEMLRSYNRESIQPFSPTEIQALPLELARVPLYWIAEANFLPNTGQIIARLVDNVRFASWVVEHSEELAQMFL